MLTSEMNVALQQAYLALTNAENELCRPREDVVTLSSCHTVRQSMKDMMRIYLAANGVTPGDNAGLQELQELCIRVNDVFSGINMFHIECQSLNHDQCDSKYCLSINSVTHCIEVANRLRGVMQKVTA